MRGQQLVMSQTAVSCLCNYQWSFGKTWENLSIQIVALKQWLLIYAETSSIFKLGWPILCQSMLPRSLAGVTIEAEGCLVLMAEAQGGFQEACKVCSDCYSVCSGWFLIYKLLTSWDQNVAVH